MELVMIEEVLTLLDLNDLKLSQYSYECQCYEGKSV